MKLLPIVCTSVLLGLCAPSGLDAQQTRHVPAQYRTVQAAINAAVNGDTVLVAPGTYRESIDFRGKAITVLSSHGPHATTLHGGTVWFRSGERNTSVLDGFTVTGAGPGIHCTAAPIIRNNIVTGNTVSGADVAGAGIYCSTSATGGVPAIILNNQITNNSALATAQAWQSTRSRGGGIFCHNAVVMGNTIATNTCSAAIQWPMQQDVLGGGIHCSNSILSNNFILNNFASRNFSGSSTRVIGGGIYSARNSWIINNTIVGNTGSGYTGNTGGVAGAVNALANCIAWGNVYNASGGSPIPSNVSVTGPVSNCNVQGGFAGPGNFNLLPQFTADGTYHLGPTSPCRNAGSGAFLNFSASDHEWDNRGFGTGVDVGADEFAPHLYFVGAPRSGSTIHLTVIGPPRQVVWVAWAARTLKQPIIVPGSGQLWLDPPTLQLLPVGPLPATGLVAFPIPIPANAPIGPVPFQALVGVTLTRPEIVQVSP